MNARSVQKAHGQAGGGLAGADVAGDEGGEAMLDGEGQAGLDLLVRDG